MKKFITSLLLFTLLLFFVYPIFIVLWGYISPSGFQNSIIGGSFQRYHDLQATKNIDLLFLGSSHSARGFDPRIFKKHGYSSFNLGSDSQMPIQTSLLLDRHLEQLKPKLIIYEICPISFISPDGYESMADLITNHPNDFQSVFMALKMNNIVIYNALIQNTCYSLLKKHPISYRDSVQSEKYIKGGYIENHIDSFRQSKLNIKSWKMKDKAYTAFKKIMLKLEKKGIPVVLVNSPITKKAYNLGFVDQSFDSLMSTHGPYFNFNELVQLNDSVHFYDGSHLNQAGVELFNERLIETISGDFRAVFDQ